MTIALMHKYYDNKHLNEVIEKMKSKGTPTIRAYHDKADDIYFAIEGCHRIRAAKKLGLRPVVDIIDWNEKIQNPDTDDILTSRQLYDNYRFTEIIEFDEK